MNPSKPQIRPIPLSALGPQPLVSVLISNYNYAAWLPETLQSLQAQTYTHWEAVVCDDGSTDNSREVLKNFAASDPRIRWVAQENAGQGAALFAAFQASRGEVICLCDADDLFLPEKLSEVVGLFLSDGECGEVIHDIDVVACNREPIGRLLYRLEGFVHDSWYKLRNTNPFPPCSGLSYRRQVFEEAIPFAARMRINADSAISQCAAYIANLRSVPRVLALWRQHGSNGVGASFSKAQLKVEWLEKDLVRIADAMLCAQRFAQARSFAEPSVSTMRPNLEYRLAVALLRDRRAAKKAAAADLRKAFANSRIDYSFIRYFFWQLLGILPPHLDRLCYSAGLKAFQWQRRAPLPITR